MKDALKAVFGDTLNELAEMLKLCDILEDLNVNVQCPDPENPRSFPAAVYSHTTTEFGNKEIRHFNIFRFMSTTIDLHADFQQFLTRDFVTKISEVFDIDSEEESTVSANYLALLFQHFVHDGNTIPSSIADVVININGKKEVRSEAIIKQYKKESQLYFNPLGPFLKKYENWEIKSNKVNSPRFGYISEIHKNNVSLEVALRDQYMVPLLRHFIKLRIIHLCVSQIASEALEQNNFFRNAGLEKILENLQTSILEEMHTILQLSNAERKKLAALANSTNTYSLKPILQKLAQHISFVKLFTGHVDYDIHNKNDKNASFLSKAKFYFNSYINGSVSKYIANRISKYARKSFISLRKFITGQENKKTLIGGFFNLIKSLYLSMWLPFLAAYFTVSGLTSMPFSLLRKAFSISFGGKWDKRLTILEAIKDSVLIYFGAPYAYTIFNAIGTFALGSVGLSLGSTAALYTSAILLSPFLIAYSPTMLIDYFTFTPGWYVTNGIRYYREVNYFTETAEGLKSFASNTFLAIHGLIAASALVVYAAVAVTGFALNKLVTFCTPKKCTKNEVFTHSQNLNHPLKFRKLLGELYGKLDEGTCDQNDTKILADLYETQLAPNKKKLLADYLTAKMGEENTPEKGTYKMALTQIEREGKFLPSWKLINRLHNELPKEQIVSPELTAEVERLHSEYSTRLSAYLA